MFSGSFYALLAGFLGAAASLSAKLSLGANYLREMCETRLSGWSETPGGSAASPHSPTAPVRRPAVHLQRSHVDLLLQGPSALLLFSQGHRHYHCSQLHLLWTAGEALLWRGSCNSVVGRHLPHSVWAAGASWFDTSDKPTRRGQERKVMRVGLICSKHAASALQSLPQKVLKCGLQRAVLQVSGPQN